MESLDGNVVWITGAGSGIGRACAIAFARAGARVALTGRRLPALEETANLILSRKAGCVKTALVPLHRGFDGLKFSGGLVGAPARRGVRCFGLLLGSVG